MWMKEIQHFDKPLWWGMKPHKSWKQLYSKMIGLWFCGVKIMRRVQCVQFGGLNRKNVKLCLKEISLSFFPVLPTFPFLHPSLPPFPFPFYSHLLATYFVPGTAQIYVLPALILTAFVRQILLIISLYRK